MTEMDSEDQTQRPPDRRKTPRYGVEEDATLFLVVHGSYHPCTVVDLGLNGCRLRTKEEFRAGGQVRVEVNFIVRGLAFRFGGVTQWTDGRHLVGIRFADVIERRKADLFVALGEIKEASEAKAKEQAALQDAQEQEAGAGSELLVFPASSTRAAEGENQRSGDLLAQLQAAGNGGASSESNVLPFAVPGTSAQQDAPAGANPVKRERRGHARHEVDTSAVIYLIKIASRLEGRILNLSLSGCSIRTNERFPVGIYTRVETEFRLEGLPFRLGGVTQALHDRHQVGIRFLDMSPRKREQLEQLIAEIEELRAERGTIDPKNGS
jgi:hypothetical protein